MSNTQTHTETGPKAGFRIFRVLKKRSQFQACAAKGVRAHKPMLSLQCRARRDDDPAIGVGFTVTKREGNAVIRNKIRRRMREAARLVIATAGTPGADYVIIGRAVAAEAPFPSLLGDLKEALAEAARRAAKGKPPASHA